MNRKSKIYVAGHEGLVGSTIVRKLQALKYANILSRNKSELDLRLQKDCDTFFRKTRPEYVFLAAAKVGGILANSTYKAEFIYDNIMIATNAIQSAYKYGVKKLLNLGSSCIFPSDISRPLNETDLLSGKLESTNEPYAVAKIAAIKLCRYYNEQYKTNFISVMPTNLYGPNDRFNLETAHLPAALLRKFILGKFLYDEKYDLIKRDLKRYSLGFALDGNINLNNKKSISRALKNIGITKDYVVLWGSGEPYREFLFIDDLVEACLFLMKDYNYEDIGEFINIGFGQDIKIKNFAMLIKGIVGFSGSIKHDLSKPDGMSRKRLDISKITSLGWKPKMDLSKGMQKTYSWYIRPYLNHI